MFELGFIPLTDKPTRGYKNSMKIIHSIFSNCVFDNTFKKAMIKSDIPDTSQLLLLFRKEKIKANTKFLVKRSM